MRGAAARCFFQSLLLYVVVTCTAHMHTYPTYTHSCSLVHQFAGSSVKELHLFVASHLSSKPGESGRKPETLAGEPEMTSSGGKQVINCQQLTYKNNNLLR